MLFESSYPQGKDTQVPENHPCLPQNHYCCRWLNWEGVLLTPLWLHLKSHLAQFSWILADCMMSSIQVSILRSLAGKNRVSFRSRLPSNVKTYHGSGCSAKIVTSSQIFIHSQHLPLASIVPLILGFSLPKGALKSTSFYSCFCNLARWD